MNRSIFGFSVLETVFHKQNCLYFVVYPRFYSVFVLCCAVRCTLRSEHLQHLRPTVGIVLLLCLYARFYLVSSMVNRSLCFGGDPPSKEFCLTYSRLYTPCVHLHFVNWKSKENYELRKEKKSTSTSGTFVTTYMTTRCTNPKDRSQRVYSCQNLIGQVFASYVAVYGN